MSLVAFITEVEDAVGSGDPIRRLETLRAVTTLFVTQAPGLNESHVSVFDEVILRLCRDVEERARSELSERLADVGNAPRKVVRDLALDAAIQVAGPVLARSPRLDEDDLVAIAREQGQDHLLALSRRPALGEGVTDVLVERGDDRVARSVAGNEGARVSQRGLARLMERARADGLLGERLRGRRDLSPEDLARIMDVARDTVRETLKEEFGGIVEEAVNAAAEEVAKAAARPEALDRAVAAVARKIEGVGVIEDDVVEWIRAGRVEEALAAIAHLADMPVETVVRAYEGVHHDPLLFIVRSVRFGWATLKLLLNARSGVNATNEDLKGAFEAFQQLSIQTAQRVVRFTAARERAAQESV
ncbi:MAG TPA: DUF2336 domain-containing protein [Beijerinckiaceae bacterium]|jgi:uncharacterized protein (DUF2336 family)